MILAHVLVAVVVVVLIKDVLLVLLLSLNFRYISKNVASDVDLPFVSVLIAARNEETSVRSCIQSLLDQNYPNSKYEILVGDDGSTDGTAEILEALSRDNLNLRVFNISDIWVAHPGKQNVLAQIARQASGSILFFTDADTILPGRWLASMVLAMGNSYDLVSGTTILSEDSWFHRLQSVEWMYSIATIKILDDLKIKITSIGNNMAISATAYKAVGGFEGIPYSITEDYEIFRQILKAGFRSFHVFESSVLALSQPKNSFKDLVVQRTRWMHGAFQLPLIMVVLILMSTILIPTLMLLILLNLKLGLLSIATVLSIHILFILLLSKRLSYRFSLFGALFFDFFQAAVNLSSFFNYVFGLNQTWKGRNYA